MTKHLHFVQSLEPLQGAGLGTSALGLHLALRQLADAHSVLVGTRGAGFTDTWFDTSQFQRVPPTKAFFAPELLRQRKRLVADADIVHGHGFYTAVNGLVGGEARRQRKALVYHVQGFFEPFILARSRLKKLLVHRLFEDANFAAVRFWRATNAKEVEQIRAVGIQGPIELIPNGVDLATIDDERKTLAQESDRTRTHKRLLFLSRIHPKKGLDLLLPAWAHLARRFPDWELHIVGPDEGGYLATAQQLVRELSAINVQFSGPVRGEAKTRAFARADAFVLPSYSEGMPMVLLEAAAFGLPIVQTTGCNFPQLTEEGGAWCAEPAVASLTHELEGLLSSNDSERIQRGAEGRRLVERAYAWSSLAEQLQAACRKWCG